MVDDTKRDFLVWKQVNPDRAPNRDPKSKETFGTDNDKLKCVIGNATIWHHLIRATNAQVYQRYRNLGRAHTLKNI